MSDLPETVGVLAFNPKANKKILNIMKEYFECLPYILYTASDSIYILPNTKTLDVIINNIYDYFEDYLYIDIFRGAIYKYNSKSQTYDILNNTWHKNVLPSYVRISPIDIEKLKVFSKD